MIFDAVVPCADALHPVFAVFHVRARTTCRCNNNNCIPISRCVLTDTFGVNHDLWTQKTFWPSDFKRVKAVRSSVCWLLDGTFFSISIRITPSTATTDTSLIYIYIYITIVLSVGRYLLLPLLPLNSAIVSGNFFPFLYSERGK
jgi:hypothetical protein